MTSCICATLPHRWDCPTVTKWEATSPPTTSKEIYEGIKADVIDWTEIDKFVAEAERKERQRILKIINDKFDFDTESDKAQFISELIDAIV